MLVDKLPGYVFFLRTPIEDLWLAWKSRQKSEEMCGARRWGGDRELEGRALIACAAIMNRGLRENCVLARGCLPSLHPTPNSPTQHTHTYSPPSITQAVQDLHLKFHLNYCEFGTKTTNQSKILNNHRQTNIIRESEWWLSIIPEESVIYLTFL